LTSVLVRWALALVAVCVSVPTDTPSSSLQQPSFRSDVELVVVDVSVTNRSRSVQGLEPTDFQLLDNGVPQRIDLLSSDTVPIDVSVIVDISSSIGKNTSRFNAAVLRMRNLLRPEDRLALLTASAPSKEVFSFQSPMEPLTVGEFAASGNEVIFDAIGQVLMRGTTAANRHLVVAFTDGWDTRSVLAGTDLIEIARRADGVLHVALLKSRNSRADDVPRTAAEATGGRLHSDTSPDDIERTFAKIFAEYRQAYLLRYTPQGVPREGWHEITVRVVRPPGNRYTVRARKGYVGG
jgi:VWFA-related protein